MDLDFRDLNFSDLDFRYLNFSDLDFQDLKFSDLGILDLELYCPLGGGSEGETSGNSANFRFCHIRKRPKNQS